MNIRLVTIMGFVVIAALARLLLAGVPNVSPMAAVALFAGAYLADRKLALLIPVAAMLLGDLILGLHQTMVFVYLAFGLTVVIGMWLNRYLCGQVLIAASLASSLVFFMVTNFGFWLMSGLYPLTLDGLVACYIAAVPFFQYTLIGDLFFVVLLFGSFMLVEQRFPSTQPAHIKG